MNTDYTAKITKIFYSVDEFCKQIEPQFKKKSDQYSLRQRSRSTISLMSSVGWCGSSGEYLLYSSSVLSVGLYISAIPIRLSRATLSATVSYVWSKDAIVLQSPILTAYSPPKVPPMPFDNSSTRSPTTSSRSNANESSTSSNSE